jgi:predicted Zn-ribbon and HTH transcriptional regulator
MINTKIEHQGKEISAGASFGIASLKDHAFSIAKALNVDNIGNVYEIKDLTGVDWDKIENQKIQISEILLKMADTALYEAKRTTCNACQFSSEKLNDFINQKCPKCGSEDLAVGRNKVVSAAE